MLLEHLRVGVRSVLHAAVGVMNQAGKKGCCSSKAMRKAAIRLKFFRYLPWPGKPRPKLSLRWTPSFPGSAVRKAPIFS